MSNANNLNLFIYETMALNVTVSLKASINARKKMSSKL